ncbi:MAG: DUF1109 domain-containing protein [Burkholderiales bacterium]|nr:DUF1109 domain-containing protein [Burkholderiales bacterium]MDR4516846.1 DUF1109 domain-containing protein [Nitrosomonas sp.]
MDNIEQLIKTLTDDATKVQPAPHPFLLTLKWTVATIVYLSVLLGIFGPRSDFMQAIENQWFVAEVLALFSIFVATLVTTSLLAFPDIHQKRAIAFAPILMIGMFLVVIFFAWNADHPPASLPDHTYECTLCIILVSLLPTVWTFYSLRKLASIHYRLAGGLALLSATSIGALWLRLYEVNDSISHVVEWHYLPMFVIGLVGLWLGEIILKW